MSTHPILSPAPLPVPAHLTWSLTPPTISFGSSLFKLTNSTPLLSWPRPLVSLEATPCFLEQAAPTARPWLRPSLTPLVLVVLVTAQNGEATPLGHFLLPKQNREGRGGGRLEEGREAGANPAAPFPAPPLTTSAILDARRWVGKGGLLFRHRLQSTSGNKEGHFRLPIPEAGWWSRASPRPMRCQGSWSHCHVTHARHQKKPGC